MLHPISAQKMIKWKNRKKYQHIFSRRKSVRPISTQIIIKKPVHSYLKTYADTISRRFLKHHAFLTKFKSKKQSFSCFSSNFLRLASVIKKQISGLSIC